MRSGASAGAFTVSDEVRTFPSYHFRAIQYVTYDMPHVCAEYGPYVTTIT